MTILEYWINRILEAGFDFPNRELVDSNLNVYTPADIPEKSDCGGFCYRNEETGLFEVWINDMYLGTKKETGIILHELIHTLPDCWNHGILFCCFCDAIGEKLGIKVPYSSEEELEKMEYRMKNAKYILRCRSCGAIIPRLRCSDSVKNFEYYRCGRCNGKLDLFDAKTGESISYPRIRKGA